MSNVCPPHLCIGCGACAAKCPNNCISINYDINGQLKASINDSLCAKCGICTKTCPHANQLINFQHPLSVVAAYGKDEIAKQNSTSGGIAYLLSKHIIVNGGVVYACIIDKGEAVHVKINNLEDLKRAQGSKYVQSKITQSIYASIKEDVQNGLNVLFVGTPCQVSATRNFLRSDYSNFYTIDLICHGVPSPRMLSEYLRYNKLSPHSLSNIVFRDKIHYVFWCYDKNQKLLNLSIRNSLYIQAFVHNIFLNDACFYCKYARPERVADLTLGDFGGNLSSANYKYCSTVIINSPKGNRLYSQVNHLCYSEVKDLEEIVKTQSALKRTVKPNILGKIFRFLYPKFGFNVALPISTIPHTIKNKLFILLDI